MSATWLDPPTWRRISEYLDHAFELSPAARESWLAELRKTEPLIASTLRKLLAEHEGLEAQGFLEQPALGLYDVPPAPASMTGKRAGAYTIERLLGHGGMGEVWLASRSDGRFEGQCAIKLLDNSVAPTRLSERFRREGRLLARLAHPNIARLIDAGMTEDNRQYLALEYVAGEPIDRYCESRALSVEARVRLFLGVVVAVSHAHANLVIHRDLKPSNVLVTGEGVVKLLDFGIAKLLQSEHSGDDSVTRLEESALTPEYAAPEQLLGEMPSTVTDIYQLGILLYVLLTGRHPLRISGSRAERVKAALDGRMPAASQVAVGPVRRQLRGDLDAILAMALRRDPQERYATSEALRDDLSRYLNREPVRARRGTALYHTRRFVQRHRLVVLASGIALAGLCTAVVLTAAARDRALALAIRTAAVTDFLDTMITEAAASDKPVTVNDMLMRSERLALADKSGNSESRAAVLLKLASHHDGNGEHDKALQLIDQALAILGESGDPDLRSELRCGRAVVTMQIESPEGPLRAIAHELDHPAADPLVVATCLSNRAEMARYLHDAEGMLTFATASLARLRSTPLASKQLEAAYLETVASAYRMSGRHKEANEYFEQSLRLFTELGRERGPRAVTVRNNWAIMSESAGSPQRALELYDENLSIAAETQQGAFSPALLVNRARALELIGRFSEARAVYESGLRATEQIADRGMMSRCLLGLADTALDARDTAAAAAYLQRAASVMSPAEPADSLGSIKLALGRGKLALAEDRIADARVEFERGLIADRSKVTMIDVQLGKAEAELLAGDAAASMATTRLALNSATSLQGGLPWSLRTGLAWLMLGRALQTLQQGEQARKAFDTAVSHLSNTVDPTHPALMQARALASPSAPASAPPPTLG